MRRDSMWRVASVLALVSAWGLAIACGSFSDDSAPPGADAGTDTSVSASDAVAPVVDSGAEAAVAFCQSGAADGSLLCADFDDGPLAKAWDNVSTTTSGTFVAAPSTKSPPNAAQATVEGLGGPVDAGDAGPPSDHAVVLKTLARPAGNVGATFEADVRIDDVAEPDGGASLSVIVLGMDFDKQAVSIALARDSLLLYVTDPAIAGGPVLHPFPRPAAGWFHLRVDVGFAGQGTRVLVNDVPTVAATEGLSSPALGFFVSIGVVAQPPYGKTRVLFDNVVVNPLQ